MDDSTAGVPAGREVAELPSPSRGKASYWLEQVDGEVERLRHRWTEAQAELDRTEARNRELEKANAQLRTSVADLQAYIDGRKEHWTQLQHRVQQYEDTLAGMEQVVRDAEDKLSRKDGERELLSNRIIELERRCAELAGRLQERERTQRDDHQRLKESAEELEGARAELVRAQAAAKEATDEASEQASLNESLERCVARRDKTIEDLERQVAEQREQLNEKARELERVAAERAAIDARANEAGQRLAALERRRGGAADEVRSLRQELVAQQHLICKLEGELESKQSAIEALQKRLEASEPDVALGSVAANGSASDAHAESEAAEIVEIIRIGELFRHDPQGRRPLAMLEAPDGTTYPVTKARVTIGRASTNDICIRREFISRTHARLIIGGIGAIIEDAGSKNGILVNSEPVGRRLLADGDVVSLGGKLDLKYVELDRDAEADAET